MPRHFVNLGQLRHKPNIENEYERVSFEGDTTERQNICFLSRLGIALSAGLPGGPPAKRAHLSQQLHPKHALEHAAPAVLPLAPPLNGRATHPHPLPPHPPLSRSNARKQVISWMDAPDDVYFRATEQIKSVYTVTRKHVLVDSPTSTYYARSLISLLRYRDVGEKCYIHGVAFQLENMIN